MGAESNTGRESHLSGTPGLYKTGPGLAGNVASVSICPMTSPPAHEPTVIRHLSVTNDYRCTPGAS